MSLHAINGRSVRPTATSALSPCPGDFAAITCFFNPCGYQRPLSNFLTFAALLQRDGVELFVVELSFNGRWEIPDVFNPLRLITEHVLWHKETLLNLLAESLPHRITKVAWVDADVVWEKPDWPKQADAALQKLNVIQLFGECIRTNGYGQEDNRQKSCGSAHLVNAPDKHNLGKWHPGFAWAARRELWNYGGLFDLHLTGGGDSLMAEAFMGLNRTGVAQAYGPAIYTAWQAWAAKVRPWCQGRLGCIDTTITHLWHGDRENRRYWERLQYLHGLDLEHDVERGTDGLLRWRRSREECRVRQLVEDLFPKRKEDG